jgi:predicted transposase/invertase (TIGR01784 family)
MVQSRILQIVRQFWENAIKLLLENPENARDLLTLTGAAIVKLIDLRRVKLIPTTFVERDYRHVESDVVLLAPLRRRKGERTGRVLLIYILIEHQSEPDRLMPLRSLDYVVQIFKYQVREWSKTHRSLARIRLYPVLPVVFYTGTRRWDSVGRLVDLVETGERFESTIPAMEPLFINLPVIPAETLEAQGGFFGWVLRLIQQRKSRPREFQRLLNRVIQHLESMPQADRRRWLELLSYIMALVYHVREPSEWPSLQQAIEDSVQTDEHRQEVFEMRRTIADELKEEGAKEGALRKSQQTLIRQLKRRFGNVPDGLSSTIRTTNDPEQLDEWLDQVVTAETLEELGIGGPA